MLYEAKIHKISYWPVAVVLLLSTAGLVFHSIQLFIDLFLVALFCGGWIFLTQKNTSITANSNHLCLEEGLFNIEKYTVPFYKIEGIMIKQNFITRYFKCGNVVIIGIGENKLILKKVYNPEFLVKVISNY